MTNDISFQPSPKTSDKIISLIQRMSVMECPRTNGLITCKHLLHCHNNIHIQYTPYTLHGHSDDLSVNWRKD